MAIKSTDTITITGIGIQLVMASSCSMKKGTIMIRKKMDIMVRTRMISVERATGTPALRMNMTWAMAPPEAPGVRRARK